MRRPLRSDAARGLANLAIDLGDPGRMARARKLHRAGAVAELLVESGHVSSTVFQEDEDPVRTAVMLSLPLRAGEAVPSATAVSYTECSCPDSGSICMHALATVLTLAEEVERDATILARWTGEESSVSPGSQYSDEQRVFLTGSWNENQRPPELLPLDLDALDAVSSDSLEVDGVDAWPVFADALRTLVTGTGQ